MQFDTTHEYYLDDPSFYYCLDHKSLIIHNSEKGVDNRILLHGIQLDSIIELAKQIEQYQPKPKRTTKKPTT